MRREDADAYADYIGNTGMAEYRSTPGNQGAWMLGRDNGDRSEIIGQLIDRQGAGDDLHIALAQDPSEDDRSIDARTRQRHVLIRS